MAPQVASLSELSRIRGDAEVRYPYARTESKLSAPGLDKRGQHGRRGRQMRSWVEGGRKTQNVGERERDIRGTGRDRLQQGDELLVKWLLFSWRASQLHFSGFSYSFPQRGAKEKNYWKH